MKPSTKVSSTTMKPSTKVSSTTQSSSTSLKPSSSTTSTKTTSTTTITPKPGWLTVCNMQFGYSFDNKGVLVCNKDSFGNIRNATEV
jgi:hypothetical protein